jgi:tRNA (guanosine-2'-O-)-methyltransferase
MNIEELEMYLTPGRVAKMKAVLSSRLGQFAIVLDNVYDPHNISAVLRSCDAFGIQDVHVIETIEPFRVNREVSHHTEKWLSIHCWPGYAECCAALHNQGFAVYATSMSDQAESIFSLPVDKSLALVFGNEHRGVDPALADHCDGQVVIPMTGFVQSLNVSVAAAVAMNTISHAMRNELGDKALLSPERRTTLYRQWLERQVNDKNRPRRTPSQYGGEQ